MNRSLKKAYNTLWWKDAFTVWAPQCLWISGGIAVVTVVISSLLALPSWSIRAAMCVAAVLMVAHYGCRWMAKRCDRRIENLGFSEVELEMYDRA